MKMLWITDDFLPHLGGSRLLYYHTIKCFRPGEAAVLTKRRPGWRDFDLKESIPIKRGFFKRLSIHPLLNELPVYAEMAVRGAYWALRFRPDVVVCGELLPTGLVGRLLSLISGTPYVIYVHGEEVNVLKNLRREKAVAFGALRAAHAVIATARPAYEEALRQGVRPDRLHLLSPAVDDYFFTASPHPERVRGRYGLGDKQVLLTVGRLVERKGHEMVIRALPCLKRDFPDLIYLVVGTGSIEERLKRVALEEGVSESVVFAGRVSREDLVDCYAACDLFVMPHRELPDGDTEGAGIVFLEAAALGKPVIAGNTGGTGDSVIDGKTGFRVDGARPEEIAGHVSRLLSDPVLARKMGETGRSLVSRERRWGDRARELERICQDLTARHNLQPRINTD
ncbi:MAG: glycosyltransferase family 4 protein [bacterium]